MKKYLEMGLLAFFLTGCAHSPEPVRSYSNALITPKPDGIFDAVSYNSYKADAIRDALLGAKETCRDRGKWSVVLSQQTYFQGMLSETDTKIASRVRSVIPSIVQQYIPDTVSSDDYKTMITFRCEV